MESEKDDDDADGDDDKDVLLLGLLLELLIEIDLGEEHWPKAFLTFLGDEHWTAQDKTTHQSSNSSSRRLDGVRDV